VVYWQGEDEEGEPNGEFSIVERGEADPAWIAYVAAVKGPAAAEPASRYRAYRVD
jgi:hypothetical protein